MNTRDRALAVRDAFVGKAKPYATIRGSRRLVFDEMPTPMLNKRGEVIGVSVMVRLFDGPTEIRIDPHRVIINPPLVPRANLTYVDGVNIDGNPIKRRVVGAQAPEAALVEAIWDSVESAPNAKGWRTRGTVTTVYATAPGGAGAVVSEDATYATARTGGALDIESNHAVGQRVTSSYTCRESHVIFNTSGIPDDDIVSAVVLSLDGSSDLSDTDFNVVAAPSSYNGGVVVTGDWVSGASLGALTTLASWNTSGYSAGYNAFTETADFKTAINKTGNTPIILYSSRHSAGNTPTGDERVIFVDADATGTTADPKLDITHAGAAAAFSPKVMMF